jgi:hypothetical protein
MSTSGSPYFDGITLLKIGLSVDDSNSKLVASGVVEVASRESGC